MIELTYGWAIAAAWGFACIGVMLGILITVISFSNGPRSLADDAKDHP